MATLESVAGNVTLMMQELHMIRNQAYAHNEHMQNQLALAHQMLQERSNTMKALEDSREIVACVQSL